MNLKDLVPEERMKIAALLAEKKGVNENAWMYEKSKEDPEAFLLGKQVQSLSQIQEICKESEESPAQRLARFDMEAKFREDPLTIMKQREAERRMELLKNTAKVKKLRRLLTEQKLRKEKHRSKMHSKRKRRHKNSDESSETSSDDELLNKFIKIIRHSDELEGEQASSLKSMDKHNQEPPGIVREKASSSRDQRHVRPDQNCPTKKQTFPKFDREYSSTHDQHIQSTSSNSRRLGYSTSSSSRTKLSKEEIIAKRAQMASDAKEYEKERFHRSTAHYMMKKIEEENELASRFSHGPSFIGHLKNRHVDMTTVEEGIHRKASSRQRGELHDNFLKR
ncbi:Pre-mRNA-splicing factor CWC25 [Schistosoma japonicum]|nr:Pre-mRNA-splicing factor CWC25 [Schistosoma japonicum]KAH8862401.1 Pre-mRNA-splicing factor CWC25 [Schistosoma japonicum]KAH8862402.1 Pre-mRNA-splicing factor CWC25 [Schistosoma japonicum]